MEHKLIFGGEQYLPFARSRIKAMRATGAKYAAQKFVMPDGEVEVRIVGDQSYIRLSGGGGSLTMDSGVADVYNIAPLNPDRYLAGALAESDDVRQYNAAFTETTANGRVNPGDTSNGQLSGLITESGNVLKGRLYGEATGSFTPAYDPATETASTADDVLAAKKRMAILCPASIFTGRCRMFVQAMYGRHAYVKGGVTPNVGPQLDESQIGLSAPPALLLQEYAAAGEIPAGADVQLSTSCGVYLDSAGKHWLFVPVTGGVTVYPLIGSASAEKLRRFLWDSPGVPVTKRLNDEDREHLEAYILSTCRPYVLRKQNPTWPTSITPYGMGYGWHWNWDTNAADIVINEQVEFDTSYTDMRSTHHRVSVVRATPVDTVANSDGSVTPAYLDVEFGAAVIEGPTTWTIERTQMTIAEPFWAEGYLGKTTPKLYRGLVCDAPFYVFYVRNDLKVCRAATVLNLGSNPIREMSDSYAQSSVYQANNIKHRTLGERDGFLEERGGSNDHYQTTFTCGGVSSPPLLMGRTESGYRNDLTNKVFLGHAPDGTGTTTSYRTITVETGYPNADQIWATTTLNVSATQGDDGMYSYDLQTILFDDSETGYAIVAVPMYDAEAIYTSYWTTRTRTITSGTIQHMLADLAGFDYQTRVHAYYDVLGVTVHDIFVRYGWNDGGPVSGAHIDSTDAVTPGEVVTSELTEKLICHAGLVDFISTHADTFHENSVEVVETQWYTLSSSSATNPVVIAPELIDQVGLDSVQAAPVIVGWA